MKIEKKYPVFMKKLGMMCIVLLGVSILSFMLLAATNKDTAEIVARRISMNVTPEQIALVRAELDLDKPLLLSYLLWLKSFFTGDFGISLTTFNPILTDLRKHLPVTGILVLLSLIWILVITIPISLLCAYRKNSLFDHAVRVLGMVGICTPAFALGIFLLLLFAVRLHIFSVAPEGRLTNYIIPSFILAFHAELLLYPALCIIIAALGFNLLGEVFRDISEEGS